QSRIQIITQQVQLGRAAIAVSSNKSISGQSRIEAAVLKPQYGISAILYQFNKEQTGRSRIGEAYGYDPGDGEYGYLEWQIPEGTITGGSTGGEGGYNPGVIPEDVYVPGE